MKPLSLLVVGVVLSGIPGEIAGQTTPPPGTVVGVAVRRLKVGLDANPKASSDYRRDAVGDGIRQMQTTGSTQFHYTVPWTDIERTQGAFDLEQFEYVLERSKPAPVAFNFKIIEAGARVMPDPYKSFAWDSPEMVDRVIAAIDRMAPSLGTRPWSYAVGNEIDMYFASRPGEVPAYARLLQRAKARIRQLHPSAEMTTSFQSGAAAQLRTLYAPIVAVLDHVAFTYYPVGPDLSVRPPTSVTGDLQTMIAAAQPLPISLQEIGYPSSPLLGSSAERQAEFVRLAFDAVRAAGTSRVLSVTYLFQADLPGWLVEDFVKAYGLNTNNFRAFLTTLGLRDERDRPKPGWEEFVRQVDAVRPKRR